MRTKEEIENSISDARKELAGPYKNERWYAGLNSTIERLYQELADLSRPKNWTKTWTKKTYSSYKKRY